jgi:hypothetical protein
MLAGPGGESELSHHLAELDDFEHALPRGDVGGGASPLRVVQRVSFRQLVPVEGEEHERSLRQWNGVVDEWWFLARIESRIDHLAGPDASSDRLPRRHPVSLTPWISWENLWELMRCGALALSVVAGCANVGGAEHDAALGHAQARFESTACEHLRLTADRPTTFDHLGASLAAEGDTVLVGTAVSNSVPVLAPSCHDWFEQHWLVTPDGVAYDRDHFGASVALSGGTALIGAPGEADNGAAYIFVSDIAGWTQQQKLVASDGARSDAFGSCVAISGDTAVVGAAAAYDANQRAVYVFTRNGSTWSQQQKLSVADGHAHDFGCPVAISGDTLAVSARDADTMGAVHMFTRSGGVWSEQQRLVASDRAPPVGPGGDEEFGSWPLDPFRGCGSPIG